MNDYFDINEESDDLFSELPGLKKASSWEETLDAKLTAQRNALGISSLGSFSLANLPGQGDRILNTAPTPSTPQSEVVSQEPPKSTSAFIESILSGAKLTSQQYNIPTSIIIAQAILESNHGKSKLATEANNLFGVKGTGPAGTYNARTREETAGGSGYYIKDNFRKYHSWAESIADHGKFLTGPRYRKQGIGRLTDPDQVAYALKAAGYATDTRYAQKLISIMKSYNLYQYDK